MPFKSIVHGLKDMKDGIWNISRKRAERKKQSNRTVSRIVPDVVLSDTIEGPWANLPPKLLTDIILRVEESETSWPARSVIVSCASVCKPWRKITKQIVKTPEECGRLTFPISLKQPGPRESPIQCFIKRDRANSVYRLYFGMSPSEDVTDKQLLAAKKTTRVTSRDFVISLVANNFSQTSNTYVGKLRSNFLGTKFNIYDSLPPSNAAFQQHGRRFHGKQVSARVPVCDYKAATISYEVVGVCTPRRMHCAMHSIPLHFDEKSSTSTPLSKARNPDMDISSSEFSKTAKTMTSHEEPLVLKNKAPLWHEKGQCWCLDFKDRVIKASRRNFQLLAAVDDDASQEKVILQLAKIGEDIFAMDYNYPLSAFQAFAICLTILGSIPIL